MMTKVSSGDTDKKETHATDRKGALAYLRLPDSSATVDRRRN